MATPAIRWREVAGFPDLADLHALNAVRYPHLLESVAHGTAQARFDILFAFPGETLSLNAGGVTTIDGRVVPGAFLDCLQARWKASTGAAESECPLPFGGGWFVFLGYELVREIEPSINSIPTSDKSPVALAQRFDAAIIRDHRLQKTFVLWGRNDDQKLQAMLEDLSAIDGDSKVRRLPEVVHFSEEAPAVHGQRIERALEYIGAGDSYQANLSRRWKVEFESAPDAAEIYRRLRNSNPAPFAALATIGQDLVVVSSSPERLVEVRGRRIQTRPIAGTYPRLPDPDEDSRQSAALIRNPKERAEHVMLVDLERNDLGKLCRTGSIEVDDLLGVESYRHVHHLVSTVSGTLREEITPVDVLKAVFPGGTITGCPKVKTIEIIGLLEREPRGAYTGSIGYINFDGSLDFNILIRTIVVSGRHVEWRAGGGIVADSQPDREIRETEAKARGMMEAIGIRVASA